jgi:hypothetical protein
MNIALLAFILERTKKKQKLIPTKMAKNWQKKIPTIITLKLATIISNLEKNGIKNSNKNNSVKKGLNWQKNINFKHFN